MRIQIYKIFCLLSKFMNEDIKLFKLSIYKIINLRNHSFSVKDTIQKTI